MARTALIASSFLPRTGGVEVHVASVATELVRHGHDVVIWATDQGDDVPAYFQDIPLRYLPCPMPARTLAATVRFAASAPSAWQSWRRALAADRPDVLHIQCFGPNGVYASALSLATGLPLVYSHHGETSGDANDVFGTSALLRSALRTTLTRASAVTSCSAHAAADLARFGRDPGTVDVIWNGIDDAEPVGTAPFGLPAKYVLGVGRLVANKGFANLIRAYAEARPDAALCEQHSLPLGGCLTQASQYVKYGHARAVARNHRRSDHPLDIDGLRDFRVLQPSCSAVFTPLV